MFTRHVSRQIAAYIDGELNLEKAERVERHAAQCADCRGERELVEVGMEALDRLASIDPPEAVWRSIEAALREQRVPARVSHVRMIACAAAIAILAALGFAYWTSA